MPNILPVDVVVRPRVAASDGGDSRLLEEVIAEVADECPIGVVWLVGGPGSGKSTALAHLAARFADDERFVFLDGPTTHEATRKRESRLVVATAPSSAKRGENILRLQPWGIDDLLEFLLAAHPAACQSVLARLGTAARQSWAPQLARIVLDRFAGDPTLTDPIDALLLEVHQLLPSPADLADATEFCLAQLLRDTKRIAVALKSLSKTDGFHCVLRLLRHTQVQVPLAAARVMAELKSRRSLRLLARQLPSDLVDLVGKRCRENPEAVRHLAGRLTKPRSQLGDAMAASMMIRADLSWRPNPKPGGHWKLSGGYFQGASWARIELANADISKCDLSGAQLAAAALEHAVATGAQFAGAGAVRLVADDCVGRVFCDGSDCYW